ncbi:MAG: 16S rRNA (cytosine(1402)-N(4))-methyltransferase RsmH [Rickettsiales bacterium]|jgi:16S rRNA (cytosine1402-N4)-methyltransferase|nr:16S rRNA (cytosine(1402)-N(4))-methyltransferase RsmH [Rickettsiales bacterium]
MNNEQLHIPVLLNSVLETLGDVRGQTVVDCTFGAGGYSRAFLERGANVIAFDRDPTTQPTAAEFVREFGDRFRFINAPFSEIINLKRDEVASAPALAGVAACEASGGGLNKTAKEPTPGHSVSCPPRRGGGVPADAGIIISAIVFDFGVSAMQIDNASRGFSFRFDAPLDMRMEGQKADGKGQKTAARLIEELPESELIKILREYGDVKKAAPIARAMKSALPQTTFALRDLIFNPKDIAPVFQALRIAVNDELGEIQRALDAVPELLAPGGICAAVSFHSLEDRIVKSRFREWTTAAGDPRIPFSPQSSAQSNLFSLLKTYKPSAEELAMNPRARSAHLRAVRKGSK